MTTSKFPSRYRIQTIEDEQPTVSPAQTTSNGQSSALQVFLADLGDALIQARIGVEKEQSWSMAVSDKLQAGRFFVQCTVGDKFKAPGGGWRMGGRWLLRDQCDTGPSCAAADQVCAALNYTVDQPARGEGKRSVIISNLVVREGRRGEGLASFLVDSFMSQNPHARLDTSMTADGARFFGFDPANTANRAGLTEPMNEKANTPKPV